MRDEYVIFYIGAKPISIDYNKLEGS